MRIGLLADLEGQRAWHRWLATALTQSGHDFVILRPSGSDVHGCPSGLQLALWLDPLWFRLKGEHAFQGIPGATLPERVADANDAPLDVLIDASAGGSRLPPAHRTIRVLFSDVPSELGAVGAVLDAGPVVFSFDDGAGRSSELARPAIGRGECLTEALDSVFSSVVELLCARITSGTAAAANAVDGSPQPTSPGRASPASSAAGVQHVAKLVSAKIAHYLGAKSQSHKRWAIATRASAGPGLVAGVWPASVSYDVVTQDAGRYYADPFLFESNGRLYLFCEEFPFATGRGVISVAEIDRLGAVGSFRPVLERPYHLSYPFVFSYAGQIWMMPESCESGAVELYRAVEFPHRWEFDRKLLADVPGCDATIFPFAGLHWMALTSTRLRGSTWDKQRLYFSKSPMGPWREHEAGLVRVDSTSARPAGAAFMRGGAVLRPAQNCSRLYGGSMTLLEVQDLSPTTCREIPVARIDVGSTAGLVGTHTYSKVGTVEAVDVWGEAATTRTVTLACRPLESSSVRGGERAAAGAPDGSSQLVVAESA